MIISRIINPPSMILALVINAITQYLCIRGVNRLAALTSALTVTILLNVRKLLSLLLSVYLFGNHLPVGVLAGAVVVFLAGALYAWEGRRLYRRRLISSSSSSSSSSSFSSSARRLPGRTNPIIEKEERNE